MDEIILPLKAQKWRAWFADQIPILDNRTPVEAAQSREGQKKLNELLDFYDSMRVKKDFDEGGTSFDVNVPSAYAKWKLGYGPGSAEMFAKEERIFNYTDTTTKPTQRSEESTAYLNKKISQKCFYIPLRCEVAGCEKAGRPAMLMRCFKCNSVYYCGKEHQVQDWPRHKLECKYIQKSGLRPKTFVTEEELKKYPLGCFPMETPPAGTSIKCFVCGATAEEVNLGYTECCNMPVCDNDNEYQMMSYSREFCNRSHTMYTACFSHYEEKHPARDWRECVKCNKIRIRTTNKGNTTTTTPQQQMIRPFITTNRFNVTPALDSRLPKGSFISKPCDTPGCKKRIIPGHDESRGSFLEKIFPDGHDEFPYTEVCSRCSDMS